MVFFLFRGAGPGCNSQEIGEKLSHLKRELTQLEDHEQMIDLHKQWVQQSITNITEDIDNNKFLYVTYNDINAAFPDSRVVPVKAPLGSCIEIVNPVVST